MINIEITGLKELIKEAERLCTPRELEQAERAALNRCKKSKDTAQKLMPRSKNVSRSGRKGSKTYQHAADNVPVAIKRINETLTLVIGWDKGDISPYFYMKMIEFGTSKMPPQAPFKRAFIKDRSSWDKIFEEEYTKLIESRLR